ncbi:unnamed protein product [Rhizopus stolonifer]
MNGPTRQHVSLLLFCFSSSHGMMTGFAEIRLFNLDQFIKMSFSPPLLELLRLLLFLFKERKKHAMNNRRHGFFLASKCLCGLKIRLFFKIKSNLISIKGG